MELAYWVGKAEAPIPVRSAERVGGPKTTAAWRPHGFAHANNDKENNNGQAKDH